MTYNAMKVIGLRKEAAAARNGKAVPQEYRHTYSLADFANSDQNKPHSSSIRGSYTASKLYDKDFIIPSERC